LLGKYYGNIFTRAFRDLLSAFGLGQKKINNILNQEESAGRLESLLNEEETMAECKSQNQRLIEFLTEKENLVQLIRYATRTPEDAGDKNVAFKYPFVASDLLSNSAKLADAFIREVRTVQPAVEKSPVPQAVAFTIPTAVETSAEVSDSSIETAAAVDEVTKEDPTPVDAGDITLEQDETKAVENLMKQAKADGEKETLVDDLNAEIDEDEDDEEGSRLDALLNGGTKDPVKRSRNDKKAPEAVEEAKTVEVVPPPKVEVTYDYTVMEEFLDFFDEDELQPILCGYFNKVM
jgi:hypothetical protein